MRCIHEHLHALCVPLEPRERLAQEGARAGITVNAICPGYIGTEMVRAIDEKVLNERIIPQIPVGRLGEPEEYARLAGLDAARMDRTDFARHPLLWRTGRRHHVRAISGVGEGGALRLMSAIEPGTVLTLGQAGDVTQGFADALDALPRPPLMVLGFDCILRRLALTATGAAIATRTATRASAAEESAMRVGSLTKGVVHGTR